MPLNQLIQIKQYLPFKQNKKKNSNIERFRIRNCQDSEAVMLPLPLGDTQLTPTKKINFVGKAVLYILTDVWLMHNASPYESRSDVWGSGGRLI